MENIPGYEVPLHRSVTQPILILGVPHKAFYLNLIAAVEVILIMRAYILLPLFILIHWGFVKLTKRDPMFIECFRRHINYKSYYST